MAVIQMSRSDALAWVVKAIDNERYSVAHDILKELIKQEEVHEQHVGSMAPTVTTGGE